MCKLLASPDLKELVLEERVIKPGGLGIHTRMRKEEVVYCFE